MYVQPVFMFKMSLQTLQTFKNVMKVGKKLDLLVSLNLIQASSAFAALLFVKVPPKK